MTQQLSWWGTWAPFWDQMENQHFSTHVADAIMNDIASPVLVIGAGLGLIVEYLKNKGYAVDGVDLDESMIAMAREKRSVNLIHANAKSLPFPDNSYATIIISSGVVDYITDKNDIFQIISESLRVLMPFGNLFIAFYQNDPKIEKINKKLGVLTPEKEYKIRRLFEISDIAEKQPWKGAMKIAEWTGSGIIPAFLFWMRLGLFLPSELKLYKNKVMRVYASAQNKGVSRELLIESLPESVPYREEPDVRQLLDELGFYYNDIKRYTDCILVKYHKSSLLNWKMNTMKETRQYSGDDWVISTKNISKRYKNAAVKAVDSLTISIKKGSIFGILGPNGAGKTTTLAMLSGILKPDSGSVLFSEEVKKGEIKKNIGYVPQDLALYPGLTGRENLSFFGMLYGMSGQKLNKKIGSLLAMVGLEDRADERVKNYSTGMMRRLNLAAGLIHDPSLILLDEPTVGIDPQSRNCIFESVLHLKKMGVTILYSTHYMEEAARLCDQVAIMDHGRIILVDDPRTAVRRFGLHRIEFDSRDITGAFIHTIKNLDNVFSVSQRNSTIQVLAKIDGNPLLCVEHMVSLARAQGIETALSGIQEPNLESLFLDITGTTLRDV